MIRVVLLVLLAALPARAARVVSLNLCADDLLLTLAPEQAVAVTFLARDPALSVVAGQAAHVPAVRADAEAVLALHPDLVLAGPYGAQLTLAVLAARGVRIVHVALPDSFPAIAAETLRVARLLDAGARGQAQVDDMQRRLAALPPRPPIAALLLEPRGWTAGPASLGAAVLRAAGLRPQGTGARLGLEAVLAHPPALLVTATDPATPSLATDMLRHPALSGIARRTVAPALLICGGPWTVGAAEALAR